MDGVRRYDGPLARGKANATDVHSKTYPDGGDSGRLKTRGGFFDKSVRVACDYAVGVRDPVSGKTLNVKFRGVNQDRDLGLFASMTTFGQYNTQRDTDSDVLRCEGIEYTTKEHYNPFTGFMQMMSEPTSIDQFAAKSIPDLARRIAQFEKTGATGNPAQYDAQFNAELHAARAAK